MAFLRIKPIRKGKTIHRYVYEVESYKHRGKVKQRTVRFLGKYVRLEKKRNKKFSISKISKITNREQLFREIFSLHLQNYGFKSAKNDVFKRKNIVADLNSNRIFDSETEKDVYLNINDKFFGTYTLNRVLKSTSSELVEFVKEIVDSGALDKEKKADVKLLGAIIEKFRPKESMKEKSFEEFAKETGY